MRKVSLCVCVFPFYFSLTLFIYFQQLFYHFLIPFLYLSLNAFKINTAETIYLLSIAFFLSLYTHLSLFLLLEQFLISLLISSLAYFITIILIAFQYYPYCKKKPSACSLFNLITIPMYCKGHACKTPYASVRSGGLRL